MHFNSIKLKNWRNFVDVDISLKDRLFIAGPNACGKSNFLDAFRFLRDIAKMGGGVQQAIKERGGLSKIRCLAARRNPIVAIDVELQENGSNSNTLWRYSIGIKREQTGQHRTLLLYEKVWKNDNKILERPNADDKADIIRLTQTHLEQVNANIEFRTVAESFGKIVYLHLVPQLLKFPSLANRESVGEDAFGIRFLDRIINTPQRIRRSRLQTIEKILQLAVPELNKLNDTRDDHGTPHLEAVYEHWRPGAGHQQEDQFSDGTLRMIGLLWVLLEGDSLLLLEEPELSLHSAIVRKLPALIWRLQHARNRQVFLSSHSTDLFGDKGIRPEEVALLEPKGSEGTVIKIASKIKQVEDLLNTGMSMAEIITPMTTPKDIQQLIQFKFQ